MNKIKKIDDQFAKGFVSVIKFTENENEGKLGSAIISTETIDRQGDKIMADGWDFKAIKKNPVMLWSHNSGLGENRPAIGRIENIKVEGGKVFFTPVFDLKDEFAKMIYEKFKNKFLNAFSIGFRPLEYTETEQGYKFIKQEALEFSAVNVPANAEALIQLRSAGIGVSKDFQAWKKGEELAPDDEDDLEEEDKQDKADKWESLNELQLKMFNLIFKDIDEVEFTKFANGYAQFGRKSPKLKHFKQAILKVALGKKFGVKKDKGMSDEETVLNLLKGIANKLEVKP